MESGAVVVVIFLFGLLTSVELYNSVYGRDETSMQGFGRKTWMEDVGIIFGFYLIQ
jgi:hypothetical protein